MDILTSIPVAIYDGQNISSVIEGVNERISRRAYENFVARGCGEGHSLEDWLDAERETIIRLVPVVTVDPQDITVEVLLPEIDLPNLAVHIAPRQFLISSDIDEDGLRICQLIDLPYEVSMDGVDAEQTRNMVRVTAALA
jgi:DUF2934 family protein